MRHECSKRLRVWSVAYRGLGRCIPAGSSCRAPSAGGPCTAPDRTPYSLSKRRAGSTGPRRRRQSSARRPGQATRRPPGRSRGRSCPRGRRSTASRAARCSGRDHKGRRASPGRSRGRRGPAGTRGMSSHRGARRSRRSRGGTPSRTVGSNNHPQTASVVTDRCCTHVAAVARARPRLVAEGAVRRRVAANRRQRRDRQRGDEPPAHRSCVRSDHSGDADLI